jgi:hypothetical protein
VKSPFHAVKSAPFQASEFLPKGEMLFRIMEIDVQVLDFVGLKSAYVSYIRPLLH